MDSVEPKAAKPKSPHAEREERILSYWDEKGIFKKSLEKEDPKGEFTFYDGPPFATGTPHYGHILAGTIKDVIPRWKTMQGFHVRRRWGWDCHGLPVENIVEKELGLKAKKDIVDYGIGKFNAVARQTVMRYTDEWRKIVPRMGRWVDMDDDYRTMDSSYTETVWWIFKQLHDKGLIYEGFKSMNLCPHCGTTLSNFEVAQGYKDITDISVYAKFKLKGEADTFLIAWTTTPWTLPGNVALAVNSAINYYELKFSKISEKNHLPSMLQKFDLKVGESYIASKDFWNKNGLEVETSVAETMGNFIEAGASFSLRKINSNGLVGRSYEPLFRYYSESNSKLPRDKSGEVRVDPIGPNKVIVSSLENGWKIYGADFVTTEDGTGIVHIAPAFGADDYDLLLKHNLPFVQHVANDGTFKKEVTDFAGMKVKPKDTSEERDAHQKADIEIIKWLSHNNGLFAKEKLIHSYPHCWRCETPLLNYAASSWFVKVTDLKDKLVAANKKITWVPPEVGSARFGNWLEGARDWAISRTRFWGAPIPVWRDEKTEKCHVIGSVDDIKKFSKAKNTYYGMRHGQAENNVKEILNSDPRKEFHLTEKGRADVDAAAAAFKGKVDLIYCSPILRAKETAEIFAKKVGFDPSQIKYDSRLSEMSMGELEGANDHDLGKVFKTREEFFTANARGVENRNSVKKRIGAFLEETERTHDGKTIMIVSHDSPLWMLDAVTRGADVAGTLELKPKGFFYMKNADIKRFDYHPLPHNDNYELDLHRPCIDDVALMSPEGNKLVRVPDVFDCWFESGSMPYGEAHYPFECIDGFQPKSGLFKKSHGYPADFIAEGLDQTRGWFYSMLVLGVALFGTAPYKKVIVNGLILAEDGQKMSKSKQNFPDPMKLVDAYGADSMRYYMLASPVVHGQDLRFSEKGVDEITKKLVNRLLNVVSFYEMYADKPKAESRKSKAGSQNILDTWLLSRLAQTIREVSDGLERGELDVAARPFMDFTDDLSTWYLRRSRDRFKGDDEDDKKAALETTKYVLLEMTKILAPFMPFLAEDIYMRLGGEKESVHLESWPISDKADQKLLKDMQAVRDISSKGLEARMAAKINVRQPLPSYSTTAVALNADLVDLVKDEINVKEIKFGAAENKLDIAITPELKEEGDVRELIRKIQDLRKEKGLSVGDKATLIATEDVRAIISKNEEAIKKATGLNGIEYGTALGLK